MINGKINISMITDLYDQLENIIIVNIIIENIKLDEKY